MRHLAIMTLHQYMQLGTKKCVLGLNQSKLSPHHAHYKDADT